MLNEPAEAEEYVREEHESGMNNEKETWAKMCTDESEFIPDEKQLPVRIPLENLRADQIDDLILPMEQRMQEQCDEQEQGNDQVQNFEPIDSDENLVNENSVPKKLNELPKEVNTPTIAEHNAINIASTNTIDAGEASTSSQSHVEQGTMQVASATAIAQLPLQKKKEPNDDDGIKIITPHSEQQELSGSSYSAATLMDYNTIPSLPI